MAGFTCIGLLLCLQASFVFMAPDNQGKEFILGFTQNQKLEAGDRPTDIELFLATTSQSPVTVWVTTPLFDPDFNVSVTVTEGQTSVLEIPYSIRGFETEKSNKGVLVQATEEIAVFAVNKEMKSTDAYVALPVDVLGFEYYALTYFSQPELMVVATEDDTVVNITCPVTTNATDRFCEFTYGEQTYSGGDTLTLTLNRMETFHALGAQDDAADFTGAHIMSDKPVSVVSGNRKAAVQATDRDQTADHLTQMMMPTNTWGQRFITSSTPNRSIGDLFRIVASKDRTIVTLYDQTRINLAKAGDFVELDIPSGQYQRIVSNKPVMMAIFCKTHRGRKDGREFGDPSMSLIIPVPQYAADYTWSTVRDPEGNEFANTITVVIDEDQVSGLILDNVPNPQWEERDDVLGAPRKVHLWTDVSPGSHMLYHQDPTVTFMTLAFGTFRQNSYAYLAGLRMAAINSDCTPTAPVMGDIVDNDCDGKIDEELLDGIDNDGDGKIDEDLAASPKLVYRCAVTGDPHVHSFTQQRSSVSIPCFYRVASLVMNDMLPSSGAPVFNASVVKVEVTATNDPEPLKGRWFVDQVQVRISMCDIQNITRETSRGCSYTGLFYISSKTVAVFREETGRDMESPWVKLDGDDASPRLNLDYDFARNLAMLSIEGVSFRMEFRPLNKSTGNRRISKPGVTLQVGGDLMANKSVEFPYSFCSTVDDEESPAEHLEDEGVEMEKKSVGIYAALAQNVSQIGQDPFSSLTCSDVMGVFDRCSPANQTEAVRQCSPLMTQRKLSGCLGRESLTAFQLCLRFACEGEPDACDAFKSLLLTADPTCSENVLQKIELKGCIENGVLELEV